MKPDPLLYNERQAIVDELTSAMRHDLRNRLSAIRNAAFYLKRRVSQLELWTSDARVQQFFRLIDESVAHADHLLKPSLARLPDRTQPKPVSAAGALHRAAELARVDAGISFDVLVADALLCVDTDELALAVRCLLESAAAGVGDAGVVRLRGANEACGYCIDISPWNAAVVMTEAEAFTPEQQRERAGGELGVDIARRIAWRYGGSLAMLQASAEASVRLMVPSPGDADAPDAR